MKEINRKPIYIIGVILLIITSCSSKQATPCPAETDPCTCNPRGEICKYLEAIKIQKSNSFLNHSGAENSYKANRPAPQISMKILQDELKYSIDEINSYRQSDEYQLVFQVELSTNLRNDFKRLTLDIEEILGQRFRTTTPQEDQYVTPIGVFGNYLSSDEFKIEFRDLEGNYVAKNEVMYSFNVEVSRNENLWIEVDVPKAKSVSEDDVAKEFGLEEVLTKDKKRMINIPTSPFLELDEATDISVSVNKNMKDFSKRSPNEYLRYFVMIRPVLETEMRGGPESGLPATGVSFDEANRYCVNLTSERSELINLHVFEWALRSSKLTTHSTLSAEMIRITNPEDGFESSLIDLKTDDFEFTTKAKMLLYDRTTKKYSIANQSYIQNDIGFRCAYHVEVNK